MDSRQEGLGGNMLCRCPWFLCGISGLKLQAQAVEQGVEVATDLGPPDHGMAESSFLLLETCRTSSVQARFKSASTLNVLHCYQHSSQQGCQSELTPLTVSWLPLVI